MARQVVLVVVTSKHVRRNGSSKLQTAQRYEGVSVIPEGAKEGARTLRQHCCCAQLELQSQGGCSAGNLLERA
jgi:hypothetical protein